jgi:peptidoglycan hydrolase CwlO-like protein
MMEGLEDVKKELEAKRQALAQELDSAVGKVASLEKDMKRVDDAIRALTKGKSRGKKSARVTSSTDGAGDSFTGRVLGGGSTETPGGSGYDPFPQ